MLWPGHFRRPYRGVRLRNGGPPTRRTAVHGCAIKCDGSGGPAARDAARESRESRTGTATHNHRGGYLLVGRAVVVGWADYLPGVAVLIVLSHSGRDGAWPRRRGGGMVIATRDRR